MIANEPPEARRVRVLLLPDPGLPAEISKRLASELPSVLHNQLSDAVEWSVGKLCTLVVGDEQVNHTSLVEVVTALIPDDDWDIAICLTDLPRRSQLRSLVAELDPEQRVAGIGGCSRVDPASSMGTRGGVGDRRGAVT